MELETQIRHIKRGSPQSLSVEEEAEIIHFPPPGGTLPGDAVLYSAPGKTWR